MQFHDDVLGGRTGRRNNGAGAVLLTLLCATGIVIWWLGVTRWWRSLLVSRKSGWRRFNWDLHSAVGFWMFAFVLMRGISGIYLSFPDPLRPRVRHPGEVAVDATRVRPGDPVRDWRDHVVEPRAEARHPEKRTAGDSGCV